MTVDADPFANPDAAAPERERAERNAELPDFFKMADLVGRHVIIVPQAIDTEDGKFGKPYQKITANPVIALDGPKDELFPELPRVQQGNGTWIFDSNIVAELRTPLKDGKPISFEESVGLPVLAYIGLDSKKKLILKSVTDPELRKKFGAVWSRFKAGELEAQAQAKEPPF